jgi:hypothetical protein
MIRLPRPRLLGIAVLLLAGCGGSPQRVHVWGTVTLDGTPIPEGTIEFTPMPGTSGPSTGAGIRDGAYDIPASHGPYAEGKYEVRISAMRATGKTMANIVPGGNRTVPVAENYVPARYNTATTLRVDIPAAAEKIDFALRK